MNHVFPSHMLKRSPSVADGALAEALRKHKTDLARGLMDSCQCMDKWSKLREENRDHLDEFIENETFAFVDYLSFYFDTRDVHYRSLYIGEKLKQLFDPSLDIHENQKNKVQVLTKDLQVFSDFADRLEDPPMKQELLSTLQVMHDVILGSDKKTLHVLFVGDCLFLDVVSFLASPLHEMGISIFPAFATSKNPVELARQIRSFRDIKFDLIFYSPFSCNFNVEYDQILDWKRVFRPGPSVGEIVASGWEIARNTLDFLSDTYDSPIFVHNAATIMMDESGWKRVVKGFITRFSRSRARNFIHGRLSEYVIEKNSKGFKQFFLFDELKFVKEFGEYALGGYFYRTKLQHPGHIGAYIAEDYWKIIFVYAYLMKKKLVVADLDNTLWDGLIGEGSVVQFLDRQHVLLELKKKGVVLAICSKNDPVKVTWKDASIQKTDFIACYISWNPKMMSFGSMQKDLNLKFRDYVFIDDSREELELISSCYPDVDCLNATDPTSWELLRLWGHLLDENRDMDRTRMYQERQQRKEFLGTDDSGTSPVDLSLLSKLELSLTIRKATQADIPRIVDLINRTNQFNTLGSRTTIRGMEAALQSSEHAIYLGDVRDRFGDMGTVSVLQTVQRQGTIDIEVFVLSCRVFGYGIERAMLNMLKGVSLQQQVVLRGRYVRTDRNQPCEHVFRDNDFELSEGFWQWRGERQGVDEPFLTVQTHLAERNINE